jgi:hypothetical protein
MHDQVWRLEMEDPSVGRQKVDTQSRVPMVLLVLRKAVTSLRTAVQLQDILLLKMRHCYSIRLMCEGCLPSVLAEQSPIISGSNIFNLKRTFLFSQLKLNLNSAKTVAKGSHEDEVHQNDKTTTE